MDEERDRYARESTQQRDFGALRAFMALVGQETHSAADDADGGGSSSSTLYDPLSDL